jgi:hypothetical protein
LRMAFVLQLPYNHPRDTILYFFNLWSAYNWYNFNITSLLVFVCMVSWNCSILHVLDKLSDINHLMCTILTHHKDQVRYRLVFYSCAADAKVVFSVLASKWVWSIKCSSVFWLQSVLFK